MEYLELLQKSVIEGNVQQAEETTKTCLDNKMDPLQIINDGLVAGMNVVGRRFKAGEMFVPEVLMSARALHAGIDLVKNKMVGLEVPGAGKVIIGTVKGDLHDIGKNLVGMMLESGGFKVINLGIDIAPEKFVAACKEHNPDIVAMSALLTTTMLHMKDTIELVKEEGLKVKCIVGGAPISQDFADEIGADGFAPDAASAVELCAKLIG